jgi:hypothetical protein
MVCRRGIFFVDGDGGAWQTDLQLFFLLYILCDMDWKNFFVKGKMKKKSDVLVGRVNAFIILHIKEFKISK